MLLLESQHLQRVPDLWINHLHCCQSASTAATVLCFSTATDFEAGAVIEKASGLYIGPSAKLVNL